MTRTEKYAEYRKSKIGESIRAKNGQMMTIIEFKSTTDITVRFEDGTIISNKRYQEFQQASIGNPNFSLTQKNALERLGETSISNTGEHMTIIAYRNCYDLDVQFDDGEILTNVRYDSFKNGTLHSPKNKLAVTRVGEERKHNNGQMMTIVAYRKSNDIDVLFEDGTLVKGVKYDSFFRGVLTNPALKKEVQPKLSKKEQQRLLKVGEIHSSLNGMTVTIIRYENTNDVDVQFEDGVILKNVKYCKVKAGKLKHPNLTLTKGTVVKQDTKQYDAMQNHQLSKIGEINIAYNKQKMIIVNYRSTNDIDIQFEDGTIVYHCSYSNFKSGSIKNPNFKYYYDRSDVRQSKRIGEKSQTKYGQVMTIIAYRNCKDLDVQFEDGTIVEHRTYPNFLDGNIKNPNYNKTKIGEQSIATNGQMMKIIAYRNNQDVDVQFDDNTIVKHKDYRSFKNGYIVNPNKPIYRGASINEIAILYELEKYGFQNAKRGSLNNIGITMELDLYNPIYKIAIEYDGQRWHDDKKMPTDCKKNKQCFDAGVELIRIREPECAKLTDGLSTQFIMLEASQLSNALTQVFKDVCEYLNKKYGFNIDVSKFDFFRDRDVYYKKRNEIYFISRIGEAKMMNCKQSATIINYRHRRDIDVQFEDGAVVNHASYDSFLSGKIANPNLKPQITKVGETSVSRDGRQVKLVNYRTIKDIDVVFDDGIVLTNQDYNQFKKGTLRHPSDLHQMPGETVLNKWNEKVTLLVYRNCDDIDVRFENGEELKHVKYENFKNGILKSAHLRLHKDLIGEKAIASNGQEMVIIDANYYNNLTVKFSDGAIVTGVIYRMFKKGHVTNPNYNAKKEVIKNRLGEVATASNGQKMTIIAYRSADDIDVRFEDGTLVCNKKYCSFQMGLIENPNMTRFQARKYQKVGETRLMNNGQNAKIIAYENAKDISIQFDDGSIYEHLQYRTFKNGWMPSQDKLKLTS